MIQNYIKFLLLFIIFSLSVTKADERILYSTTFADWTALASPSSPAPVIKTTNFTNETLTFNFLRVAVNPTSYDNSRFNYNIASTGALIADKMGTAAEESYIETSPLASITKLYVVIGATGSNRGYKIWKKADGDADWVAIHTAFANPASGDSTTIAIPGGKTNVALKFTNLAYGQNAYLFELKIFGNYNSTAEQKTLSTSINIPAAGSVTKTPDAASYDLNSKVVLKAQKSFGYKFDQWVDSVSGTVLSTSPEYEVTMDANKKIRAIFSAVNTYELKVNVGGGAKDYMISYNPAPTIINSKKMYESGTNVLMTAANNPVMLFTNWSTGATGSELSVTMDADKEYTASYSASEYIVGWDFYKSGASGRVADFYSSSENETSNLNIRTADGTTSSWLDKSQVAGGGYEGQPAAVNWKNLTDKYYYQIRFNASNFTDLSVKSSMLLNYNGYSKQFVEYSTNGTDFTSLGTITISAVKVWCDSTFKLPSTVNNATDVYIRWIPDYTSGQLGTTATNDGTAISAIYVYGKTAVVNDGVAPVLVSSVPAQNGIGASTSGKIVLTFDEKIQLATGTTATLGAKTLTPVISGKTITFNYIGLDYNTAYTFNLPSATVSDLGGNTLSTAVSLNFTTLNRPTVTKKMFNFVVGVDGDFKAALAAAQAASSSGERFYIFFPDGQYNIGENTGDTNQKTVIALPNISYIGQSSENVILYNQNTSESIGTTATINFTTAANSLYLQDMTLRNKDFRSGANGAFASIGRCVALQDQGNKNIYKNVNLQSNQDTYYSGNGRLYFEGGSLHGTVDFLCGGGDVFFNECLLYLENRAGNCITANASSSTWGYVFKNCTIDGFETVKNNYRLGRPWNGTPKVVYLNTVMKCLPDGGGWGDPMNVVPSVFAEYNSITESGNAVDLSSRRTSYTYGSTTVTLNPVLSALQASTYTIDNVLGGTDNWQPQLYTDQAAAPVISANSGALSWADNNYVLCWAVFKDNVFVKFVTTNSYTVPAGTANGSVYTVRAANEMGGLGASSNAITYTATGLVNTNTNKEILSQSFTTPDGKKIATLKGYSGFVIVRSVYKDGTVSASKIFRTDK